MRHRKHKHQLGVKKEHRLALIANLAAALLNHGRIQTTLAKAKALRPFVEKVITLARKANGASTERALYLRRLAIARVRDKSAVHLLFDKRVEEFLTRDGGYTRIYKVGTRVGDGAEMALIELIDKDDEGYRKSRRRGRKGRSRDDSEVSGEEPPVSASDALEDEVKTEGAVKPEASETEVPSEDSEASDGGAPENAEESKTG